MAEVGVAEIDEDDPPASQTDPRVARRDRVMIDLQFAVGGATDGRVAAHFVKFNARPTLHAYPKARHECERIIVCRVLEAERSCRPMLDPSALGGWFWMPRSTTGVTGKASRNRASRTRLRAAKSFTQSTIPARV